MKAADSKIEGLSLQSADWLLEQAQRVRTSVGGTLRAASASRMSTGLARHVYMSQSVLYP